jgi:hypothetical protein
MVERYNAELLVCPFPLDRGHVGCGWDIDRDRSIQPCPLCPGKRAAETEALARVEGKSLIKPGHAIADRGRGKAAEQPKLQARLAKKIKDERELSERLVE